jgi:hypothetical protein
MYYRSQSLPQELSLVACIQVSGFKFLRHNRSSRRLLAHHTSPHILVLSTGQGITTYSSRTPLIIMPRHQCHWTRPLPMQRQY